MIRSRKGLEMWGAASRSRLSSGWTMKILSQASRVRAPAEVLGDFETTLRGAKRVRS